MPEARKIYVSQAQFGRRLLDQTLIERPLVVYDVGLGIAANAIASIEECERIYTQAEDAQSCKVRNLEIHSFENDIEGLKLALNHLEQFPFLSAHETTLKKLLDKGSWNDESGRIHWELHTGDYFETQKLAPHPEIIFYDFYGPKKVPELWSEEAFRKIKIHLDHYADDLPTELFTYTAATPVRCAMKVAGFHVGYGIPTTAKRETTIASTDPKTLSQPLGRAWLDKLSYSTSIDDRMRKRIADLMLPYLAEVPGALADDTQASPS